MGTNPSTPVRHPRSYRVRKGYVWVSPKGEPTGAVTVTEDDPAFSSQLHKLEPIPVGESEPDPRIAVRGESAENKADAEADETEETDGKKK